MNVDDAERCAELERALFAGDGPWSAQAFVSELAGAHNHYFVAREPDGHVLGYAGVALLGRSEEHTSELQSLMRISYAAFCCKKQNTHFKRYTSDINNVT